MVVTANERLRPLAKSSADWAIREFAPHFAYRSPVSHKCVCSDCGGSFKYDGKAKSVKCPVCGRRIDIVDTSPYDERIRTLISDHITDIVKRISA